MGFFTLRKIAVSSGLTLAAAFGVVKYQDYTNTVKLSKIVKWAEANKIDVKSSNIDLKPFKIQFDETEWKKLVAKLENTRYFSLLDEKYVARQEFGFDPEYARELVDYWKSKFDWRKQVEKLNRFNQFKININDTVIHFVREVIDNKQKETIKIVLMDGWPGSFFGFYKMLDYIKENGDKRYNYDIVIPSIPGYGYSTPLNRPVDATDTAQLVDAVMRYLHGEDVKYYIHGEDWGSLVTLVTAKLFPSRVNGIHVSSSMPFYSVRYFGLMALSKLAPSLVYSREEIEKNLPNRDTLMEKLAFFLKDGGYMHLQATRPDTVGHALTDSPVGLMAYILEKYSTWTFDRQNEVIGTKDGCLEKLNRDELLTIITFYWMTNSITSSIRFYKNFVSQPAQGFPKDAILATNMHSSLPCAVQLFKNELLWESKASTKLQFPNLKRFTLESDGGHFCASKNPKESADDFFAFIFSTLDEK